MTEEGERIATLEATLKAQREAQNDLNDIQDARIAELEQSQKNALIAALFIVGGGFAILFGVIAKAKGLLS